MLDAVLSRPLGPIVIMAWLAYAFVPSHVVPLLKASRGVYTRRGPESKGLRYSHVTSASRVLETARHSAITPA